MFSVVVMAVPKSLFERVLDEIKESKGVHFDTELTADDLRKSSTDSRRSMKRRWARNSRRSPAYS